MYFKIEREDELRKTGFSKEGRHQNPQIVLGLLVSIDGYPLAYSQPTISANFKAKDMNILGARIKSEKIVD